MERMFKYLEKFFCFRDLSSGNVLEYIQSRFIYVLMR